MDTKSSNKHKIHEREYQAYMDEVTNYLAKVENGRRVARQDPNHPRFSQAADNDRLAKRAGLTPQTNPMAIAQRGEDPSAPTYGFKAPAPDSFSKVSGAIVEALTPRIKPEELLGPVGQSAFTSGLVLGAFGGPVAGVAGGVADLLSEEGTRRLKEHMSPEAAVPIGTALSMVSSAPAFKAFPSYATADLAGEILDAIPAGSFKDMLSSQRGSFNPGKWFGFGKKQPPLPDSGGFNVPTSKMRDSIESPTFSDAFLEPHARDEYLDQVKTMNQVASKLHGRDAMERTAAREYYDSLNPRQQEMISATREGREDLAKELRAGKYGLSDKNN